MSEEKKNSIYDRLTPQRKALVDEVMNNLENGAGLWKQGWVGGGPVSALTGKRYNGINRLFLTYATMARGYKDNRWLTYKQMTDKGWHFKVDEAGNNLGTGAGVAIEYFELRDKETKQPFDRHTLDGLSREEQQEYMDANVYPLRKYYRVFNGDVIEGIPALEAAAPNPNGVNERAEKILQIWNDSEAGIIYGGSSAYYIPSKDEIHVPPKSAFFDMQEFYSTTLHEIGHSTGHESRLNRDMTSQFGTPEYAEEELRAEIASMFLAQDLEIPSTESHIQNNSAYIGSWKAKIEANPNVLFTAIADAERIAKFVMAKEAQKEREPYVIEEMEKLQEAARKREELSKVEEEKSEIFVPPSEVIKEEKEAAAVVDMTERGIESLTNMDDREIIERAGRAKGAEKFSALYNGVWLLETEERNERSLMARLAVYTDNEEQLFRLFRSSGQYHAEKPPEYYRQMAQGEIKFIAEIRAKMPTLPASGSNHSGRYANAKS